MAIQKITSGIIADGAIVVADIADGSITTAKIADANVTASKLASGAALPSQTGNTTYYLTTDGSSSIWKAQTALAVANTQISGRMTRTQVPLGSVLQVLSVTDTTHYTFNSGSSSQYTYYDVSGLSLTITPTSSSSKILILAEICASQTADSFNAFFRASRDSTAIGIGVNGVWGGTSTSAIRTHNGSEIGTVSINFLDSPATTSATTYKVQICNSGGSGSPSYVNRPAINTGWEMTGASTLTIMEISA